MKAFFVFPFLAVLSLSAVRAEPSPVIPKDWLKLEQLEQVEDTVQKQLDTGKGMTGTAWDMATVKDAEFLVVYIALFEKLPEKGRNALRKEQEVWLQRRGKAAAKADDGKSGTMGHLLVASECQTCTERRIVELKKRLAKK